MRSSEEHHEWNTFYSWLLIFGLTASLFIVMFILMLIPVGPREWDFGTDPFVPSESIYSSSTPEEIPKGKMVEPLPEGVPMNQTK